jgi:hypothetical protein
MKIESSKKPEEKGEKFNVVGERLDEKLQGPGKYVVTKDKTFKVRFGLVEREGRWVVIKPESGGEDHWVEFRIWTFNEEVELRKMATIFDPLKKIHIVDNDYLNRLKVQRLMLSWSFDKANDKLKLLHVNGVLADEGWKAFTSLFPSIIRFVLESMNAVLECGE